MLLTITLKANPATDLGFLLHKNPARVQEFSLSFGKAHVFYPEVRADRCTAALLLEMDTIRLVRAQQRDKREVLSLSHYVNDRPYVASSFLSVAIAQVFGTALSGRSKERQALTEQKLPFEASVSVVSCRGGEELIRRCFEPLGYTVELTQHPLDAQFPEWGMSSYYSMMIAGEMRLAELLSHLYVLLPVLDRDKHYFIGQDEQEKLLKHAETWLPDHPEKQLITTRYLNYRRSMAQSVLDKLTPQASTADTLPIVGNETKKTEQPVRLNDQRLAQVAEELKQLNPQRVLDLGCGEGKLIRQLVRETQIPEIVGVDLSLKALEIAKRRLKHDWASDRIKLLHSSLLYRDDRLTGFDVAAVVEVIEHLEPERLAAFSKVLFQYARPEAIILTTPNIEYNVKFEGMKPGKLRHRDHRFEWTRAQFREWAQQVCADYGYAARFAGIGTEDEQVGTPTQMAVFTKQEKCGDDA